MVDVDVRLAEGPPAQLRVPTSLSLVFEATVADDGSVSITSQPTRDDLLEAARMAHAGEARALRVAIRALDDAEVPAPAGGWAEALETARLDARLPRERFAGRPSWHLMFGPFTAEGWTDVLIDAETFEVRLVNGRSP